MLSKGVQNTRVLDGSDQVSAAAELLPHEPDDGSVVVEADRAEVLQVIRHHLEAERAADAVADAFSVSGDDPSVARLLADDAVHPAVDPTGECELHRAGAEPRDAAAAVGALPHEGAILRAQSVMVAD